MWGSKKKNLPWHFLLPQMPKAVSKLPHLSATTVHSVLGRKPHLFFDFFSVDWHWIDGTGFSEKQKEKF